MDTCAVETGLLRKKPCGGPAVAHCLNCERALCTQHAVAQKNEGGHHTGKFLCKECQAAWKEIEKNPAPKPAVKKPVEKPGAAPAAHAAPAAAKAAKAPEAKPAEAKPADHSPGTIEFTPSKPAGKK